MGSVRGGKLPIEEALREKERRIKELERESRRVREELSSRVKELKELEHEKEQIRKELARAYKREESLKAWVWFLAILLGFFVFLWVDSGCYSPEATARRLPEDALLGELAIRGYHAINWEYPDEDDLEFAGEILREHGYLVFKDRAEARIELFPEELE